MDASSRGSQNQGRGEMAEGILKAYHQEARARKVAWLTKVPTPTQIGQGGKMIYTTKSTVDFVGMMLDGSARFVAEEVKSFFEGTRFSMSNVKPHQRAFLDGVHDAGGVAVLTVADKLWQIYVCPWGEVRSKTSLTYDDLRDYRVRPPQYLSRYLRAAE
jgi:penicillin-binding protein-related factor A (putative recombinase)